MQTSTRTSPQRPLPPRPLGVRDSGDVRFTAPRPLEQIIAIVLPVSLGVGYTISNGVQVGHVVAFLLLPVWFSSVRRFRGGRIVLTLGAIAPIGGAVLTAVGAVDHSVSPVALFVNSVEIIGLVLGIGSLLWARRVIGGPWVAVFFGLGMVAGIPFGNGLSSANPWRFAYSLPLTVLLLAIAWQLNSRVAAVIAAGGLCIASALNDGRGASAMLAMTAMLVLWQVRPTAAGRRASAVRTMLSIAALASVVYTVAQAVILGGLLGERTQERTQAQIDTSGSLILGGRPEAGATVSLIGEQPLGYGSGIVPNLSDILTAKTGMSAIGYSPNNGYVENYMFGSTFEVHSIVGDLWILYGLAGAALALVFFFTTFQILSHGLAHRAASALIIWLAVRMLWNLLFSPVHSSVPLIMLFLGIGLVARATEHTLAGPPHPSPHHAIGAR
ncbi:hypothetical protein ELQ92_12035 [Labedella populi]|uniref:O-antigen ligase domain-containing protein n=1 Tax=Labedella populi TaxID=2498850 RepID=A0A444Q6M1_9MICO|nr:hypothetical protein [Labedella populi]RWZ59555.1 hypothetical protein ELQ92_12035 [Labedella populi]